MGVIKEDINVGCQEEEKRSPLRWNLERNWGLTKQRFLKAAADDTI